MEIKLRRILSTDTEEIRNERAGYAFRLEQLFEDGHDVLLQTLQTSNTIEIKLQRIHAYTSRIQFRFLISIHFRFCRCDLRYLLAITDGHRVYPTCIEIRKNDVKQPQLAVAIAFIV